MTSSNYAVLINGSGLLCKSYNLQRQSSVEFIPSFGQKQLLGTTGPSYGLNLSYLFNTLGDQFITHIANRPTGNIACQAVVAGQSGLFYLSNYSFQTNAASALEVNASLVNFNKISGEISEKLTQVYSHTGLNEVLSNSTSIKLNLGAYNFECNSLSYSYSANVAPKYKIGDGFPYSVEFLGSEEQINLTLWSGFIPSFYGSLANNLFNGNAVITIANDNKSVITKEYTIPLSGFAIQSYDNSLSVNDLVRYSVSLVNKR